MFELTDSRITTELLKKYKQIFKKFNLYFIEIEYDNINECDFKNKFNNNLLEMIGFIKFINNDDKKDKFTTVCCQLIQLFSDFSLSKISFDIFKCKVDELIYPLKKDQLDDENNPYNIEINGHNFNTIIKNIISFEDVDRYILKECKYRFINCIKFYYCYCELNFIVFRCCNDPIVDEKEGYVVAICKLNELLHNTHFTNYTKIEYKKFKIENKLKSGKIITLYKN
jgi:hypothetical protein